MFEGLTGVLNIFVIGIFIDVFKDSQNFWLTLVGGVLLGLGSFAINLAIMEGKIGPAMVICNCNGILQMVFDFGFRDFVPETGKLAGGVVAIVGAAILLLWKEVVKK